MNTAKVEQMTGRTGKPVANQFIVHVNSRGTFFQSYKSIIAGFTPEGVVLDEKYWDYSTTTSKYRNQFLNSTTKETKAKIKSGEYKLVDLNGGY